MDKEEIINEIEEFVANNDVDRDTLEALEEIQQSVNQAVKTLKIALRV